MEWLRREGHDAVHLRERGWHRMADARIFAEAAAEGRVVLTFDLDFGEIAAASADTKQSVVIFRLHNARWEHVIGRLRAALPSTQGALETGAVVVIEESRHRIRYLPVGSRGEDAEHGS